MVKKILYLFLALSLCLSAAACSKKDDVVNTSAKSDIRQNTEEQNNKNEAYIYIGRGEDYEKYSAEYEGALTAEILLEKMEELTGWNLSLAEEVISGKSGMCIDFSKQSSVYTGKADKEIKEFLINDKDDLICTILDSVCRTIQMNFVDEALGDPNSLEITYSCEGEPVSVGGNMVLADIAYTPKAVEKYTDTQILEFITNQLSNYYDASQTLYERGDEKYEKGKLIYIYTASDKETGEILGKYGVTSDLMDFYDADKEPMELIVSFREYRD